MSDTQVEKLVGTLLDLREHRQVAERKVALALQEFVVQLKAADLPEMTGLKFSLSTVATTLNGEGEFSFNVVKDIYLVDVSFEVGFKIPSLQQQEFTL